MPDSPPDEKTSLEEAWAGPILNPSHINLWRRAGGYKLAPGLFYSKGRRSTFRRGKVDNKSLANPAVVERVEPASGECPGDQPAADVQPINIVKNEIEPRVGVRDVAERDLYTS